MSKTKAQMIMKKINVNRKKLLQEYPGLAAKAQEIKTAVAMNLQEYAERTIASLKSKGCHVVVAVNAEEVGQQILRILSGTKHIAMSKNPVFTEIALKDFLQDNNVEVTYSDLGERLANATVDAHPWIATINTDIADKVKVSHLKDEIKQKAATLEYGITGAEALVEQNGTITLLESEGNVRFTSNLPYNHIVIVGLDKIVPTLEDALTICRATSVYGLGKDMLSYISFIHGPSRTADIEFKMVQGMHGPKEVYVILLDNGRLAAAESQRWDLLKCLGCGGCLVNCHRYLEEGLEKGYRFTGKRAKVLAGFLEAVKQAEDAECGDCLLCNDICPVGICI